MRYNDGSRSNKIYLEMKSLIYLLATLSFLTLIISCNKDDQDIIDETVVDLRSSSHTEADDVTRAEILSNLDAPEISGDVLYFSGFEHFSSYYSDLEQLLDVDQQAYNNLIDSTSSTYDGNGSSFISVHAKLRDQTFTNPEEMYQPFLTDPIMMCIVNEHFEFRIGDQLLTHMNNSYIAICNISATNERNEIRTLTKGGSFDAGVLPKHVIWCDVIDLEDRLVPRSNHDCDCNFETERIDCDLWRMNIRCENDEGEPIKATIKPYYDNQNVTPGYFSAKTIDGNGSYDFTAEELIRKGVPKHTTFTATTFFNDPFATLTIEYETDGCKVFGVPLVPKFEFVALMIGATCDSRDKDSGYLWKDDGANQGFSYRTSTSGNWRGRNYENAEIWSKYKDSQGIWRYNNELFIRAGVTASRLNSKCSLLRDNGDFEVAATDSQECNCHYRGARTRAENDFMDADTGQEIPAYCDSGITGRYYKSYTWQGVLYEIEAKDESLEFECCSSFGNN